MSWTAADMASVDADPIEHGAWALLARSTAALARRSRGERGWR